MVESGKRTRHHRDHDGDDKNQKRRVNDRDEKGNDELVVYRILCPDSVIGSVIGKSGKVINSIRQETRAKVKVVDPFPGTTDRVITIYCYVKEKVDIEVEDFDEKQLLCPAQDALLKVHAAISNAVTMIADSDNKRKDKEECQILVPSSQSASIIGKAGSTIKKLRSKTRTSIRVTAKDASNPTHSCAMDFDNFVLITGESDNVKKALFAVSAIMYKFAPKEEISLETTVMETPASIIIPSDVPIYPPSGLYANSGLCTSKDPILPSRSISSISRAVPEIQGIQDSVNSWSIYSSTHLPMSASFGSTLQSRELQVRVLCSNDKIGRVIGKGGITIKSIRQTSGARIVVDDSMANRGECIITIHAMESPDDLKSMAIEAVLLLQEKINDEADDNVNMRLLIPSKVIGCIIGKSGSIIAEIRKRTKADIRISKGEKPKCALPDDEFIEVAGDVIHVRDALVQIVLRLRHDVLKAKENIRTPAGSDSLYSSSAGLSVPSLLPEVSTLSPLSYDLRAETGTSLGLLSSSGLYGYGSLSVGENAYGSIPSYISSKLYGRLTTTSLEMLVPANAVGKVMGKGGSNMANIKKISGAMVELSDAKSGKGDRIAIITGTPEQKRSAENLIQAFIMAT